MAEIVAELSQLARQSPHVNQRSGVSVRLSISNYETLAANAVRRSLRLGESDAVPRISDLGALVASTQGKIEIEALEEGREERILQGLVSAAVLTVFRRRCPTEQLGPIVNAFDEARVVHAGDDLPASAYAEVLAEVPALEGPVLALAGGETPGAVACRGRVHPGGPAPHQAPQQGGGGDQGHLPGPGMTAAAPDRATRPARHDPPLGLPALGRHPDRLRGRGRRPLRRARRRPALPRRPRRGAAPPAHLGLRAPRRRAGPGPARAHGAPAPAAPGGARQRRSRAGPSTRSPRSSTTSWPRSARACRPWPTTPASRATTVARRSPTTSWPSAASSSSCSPRPGRPGPGPAALRLRLLRGARALRAAPREAARGDRQELLRPDVRGHDQPRPRAARTGPADARRPQPHDGAAPGGRGPRPLLRVVHGALRRLLPRQPPDPGRAPRAVRGADGGGPGRPRLDVPRAAGPAPGPRRVAVRGHGPALADGPPGREPAPGRARGGLGPALLASAVRTPWAWPTRPPRPGAWARWTSSSSSCARPPPPGRWPRSTSTRWPSTWATTGPARSTHWPAWPSSSRRPASSSSAKAATS